MRNKIETLNEILKNRVLGIQTEPYMRLFYCKPCLPCTMHLEHMYRNEPMPAHVYTCSSTIISVHVIEYILSYGLEKKMKTTIMIPTQTENNGTEISNMI